MRELAPAKVNLNLYLGPLRADGRHELVSVMQSITLCDELELADGERDEVLCAGVEGPNLAASALTAFREATGWDGPGQRIEIVKRSDDIKGFVVLPRRWVVERTFSWFGRNRRLNKDYENLADTLLAFVTLAAIQLGVRRLARA